MGPFDGELSANFWNPKIRGPVCFNPPAARSILPMTYKRTEMVLAGQSKAQIKNQNLCIVGYGVRSRTSCQGYFGISIRHQVLAKRGHAGIRGFGLCLHLRARTQRDGKHGAS
jgi:hypothetical protein